MKPTAAVLTETNDSASATATAREKSARSYGSCPSCGDWFSHCRSCSACPRDGTHATNCPNASRTRC